MIWLICAACIFVGLLIGATGMGGILIPPVLMLIGGMDAHPAMGTALASFLPGALIGLWQYGIHTKTYRWSLAIPFSLGGLVSAAPGAFFAYKLPGNWLVILLALVIIACGIGVFKPPRATRQHPFWTSATGVFLIGFLTGIIAGMTGAGGPVLTIPWMILVGFAPLTAVGIAFPYQIATTLSGTLGNWMNSNIDWAMLASICACLIPGTLLGLFIGSRLPQFVLRRAIACLCIGLGIFLIVRSLV